MGSVKIEDMGYEPGGPGSYAIDEHPLGEAKMMKIICIGAGASGLNFAYQGRRHLKNTNIVIYEKNETLGGTWFENTYPGCACDIPSHIYQFTWSVNPDWSQFYAGGSEIQRYLENTAKKFELEGYIRVNHKVTHAQWFEGEGIWKIRVLDQLSGREIEDWCNFLVNGSGVLNHWQWPNIPSLHSFKGTLLHSAQWDDHATFENKRIAVIGNGSSGIQLVTALQPGML